VILKLTYLNNLDKIFFNHICQRKDKFTHVIFPIYWLYNVYQFSSIRVIFRANLGTEFVVLSHISFILLARPFEFLKREEDIWIWLQNEENEFA
jgi:hypothetical protein